MTAGHHRGIANVTGKEQQAVLFGTQRPEGERGSLFTGAIIGRSDDSGARTNAFGPAGRARADGTLSLIAAAAAPPATFLT